MRQLFLTAIVAFVSVPFAHPQSGSESQPESRQEILLRKRREKAEHLEPYRVSEGESRVHALEKAKFPQNILVKGWRGVRPVIGGMPSGSGFVLGGGYVHGLENQYYQFQVNGRYSTRGFTTADAEFVLPPPQVGRRVELKVRGEYRDLTALRFYGLGNDSSVDDRSTYLLNDQSGTVYLWLNPRGLLSFGAQTGIIQTRTDTGQSGRPIDDAFDTGTIPGFGDPTTQFVVSGGWAEFDIREKWSSPPVGIVARVTALHYEDTGISQYDFTRIIGDVKGYIPLGKRNRILALRLYTSHSEPQSGKDVPFYLMETLGGAANVRGFREFRFRDTRNFLASAEYRWEVLPFADMTVFFDAGKVFQDRKDFNFEDMHTGYGVGFRAHNDNFVLRLDLAQSREGFRFHIGGGPSF